MKIFVVWGDFSTVADFSKPIYIARTYKQVKKFLKRIETDVYLREDGLYYVETYMDNWNGQTAMLDCRYGTCIEALCKRVYKDFYGEDD